MSTKQRRFIFATFFLASVVVIGSAAPSSGYNRIITASMLVPTWNPEQIAGKQEGITTTDLATTTITPERFLDTRPGAPALGGSDDPLGQGETRTVQIGGLGSVPIDAVSVIINVTAVNATSDTYIAAFPAETAPPPTSLLNPEPGNVAANSTTVSLNSGKLALFNLSGTVDVIIDVMGFMTQDLKEQADILQGDVAQFNLGDAIDPPQSFGGQWSTEFAPDWRGTGENPQLSALVYGIEPGAGRYSTMQLELILSFDALYIPDVTSPPVPGEACFRIASDVSGPVLDSETCFDATVTVPVYQETKELCIAPGLCGLSNTSYWKVISPRVSVPEGTVYLEGKVLTGSINTARHSFRFFG